MNIQIIVRGKTGIHGDTEQAPFAVVIHPGQRCHRCGQEHVILDEANNPLLLRHKNPAIGCDLHLRRIGQPEPNLRHAEAARHGGGRGPHLLRIAALAEGPDGGDHEVITRPVGQTGVGVNGRRNRAGIGQRVCAVAGRQAPDVVRGGTRRTIPGQRHLSIATKGCHTGRRLRWLIGRRSRTGQGLNVCRAEDKVINAHVVQQPLPIGGGRRRVFNPAQAVERRRFHPGLGDNRGVEHAVHIDFSLATDGVARQSDVVPLSVIDRVETSSAVPVAGLQGDPSRGVEPTPKDIVVVAGRFDSGNAGRAKEVAFAELAGLDPGRKRGGPAEPLIQVGTHLHITGRPIKAEGRIDLAGHPGDATLQGAVGAGRRRIGGH